jgi:galactose mutarotase-like enzyme
MAIRLFGREHQPAELRRLVGSESQLAGVRLVELADGFFNDTATTEIYTGSGLRFLVLIDRGLDVGPAEDGGRSLAWVHPAFASSALHEPSGIGWLRTFGGGLVTTCGLTHYGAPDDEGPEGFGLHGRASHLPAENVRIRQEWRGEEYVLEIEGETRQSRLFGENLRLERRVATRLGATSLAIEDRVTNEGFQPAPLAVLYHCNFGFPVVSPDSELVVRDREVRPRDAEARAGFDVHRRLEAPQDGYAEQVFFHEPRADADGLAAAGIVNRSLAFGAFVRWRAAELPVLAQWKMMGPGEYVCGLEPSTHEMAPTRRELRERGLPRDLGPGASAELSLEIGSLPDADAIAVFEASLPSE